MAGVAIGLGNVWRFPYMMGQNGGAAFLLVYLLFILLLAVPALMGEWILGRSTRHGPVQAFRAAFGTRWGMLVGTLVLIGVFGALSYYNLVVGNVFFSAWHALTVGFDDAGIVAFGEGLGRPGLQFGFGLGVTAASAWIIHLGLKRGIERANRWLVPFFGIATLYLVFVALRLPGALDHLGTYLQPDFTAMGPRELFAAMGQACFSVGISGALGVMYGSYLRRQEMLAPTAVATGLMDTGAAILASLFVVPAVLVFGLDMAAGPGLLFNTLPQLFSVMPGGRWLAALFLSGWALVALLSIIGTLEAIVGSLVDLRPGSSRGRWTLLVTGALIVAMIPVAWHPQHIGTLDLVFGSGMFMFGALMAAIGAGWGLGKMTVAREIRLGLSPRMERWLTAWIRWVVPLALGAILLGFLISTLTG